MIALTPERAALLNEVATLEGRRPELGGLVEEGSASAAQATEARIPSSQASRRRLADRVRERSLNQDPEAADRVKRLGLES
jgi:hypothetical protein